MRPFAIAGLVLWLSACASSSGDAVWQNFSALAGGDRALAESALAEMFGDDPALWPDWLEPQAAQLPASGGAMLVVRQPVHAPCGQYRYSFFAPVSGGRREKLGGDFCAGSLEVVPGPMQRLPDFWLREGWVEAAKSVWQRQDRRIRWNGQEWRLMASNP